MDSIAIKGIGVISCIGNDVETIWANLMCTNELEINNQTNEFDSGLSLSQQKKANRYSEMGIYVVRMAMTDAKLDVKQLDKDKVGTIFTTGYGPIVSALEFSKKIAEGDYEYCSPALFANTVNNTCIGHICMFFGFKGVSTMLMGSNNLAYAQFLINKGNAEYVLSGSVEERCPEVTNAFKLNEVSKNVRTNEGAISFLLTLSDHEAYCRLVDYLECSIISYPMTDEVEMTQAGERIEQLATNLAARHHIDVFFSSANGSYFDDIELTAVQKSLSGNCIFVNQVKKIFGETLGSAFNLNVMVAAMCMKNGYLPIQLDTEQRRVKCALVSGYDISGNYTLVVLKQIKK